MATPICATCRKPVNERAVFALGKGYHPACFWPNGVPAAWRNAGVPAAHSQTKAPADADGGKPE